MLNVCGVLLTICAVALVVTSEPVSVLVGIGEFNTINTRGSNGKTTICNMGVCTTITNVVTSTICDMKGCTTTVNNKTQTVSEYTSRLSNKIITTNCTPKGCTTTVTNRPQTVLDYILSMI